MCVCVEGGACLSSVLLCYTCLGQGWPLFFSKRTPLQMCGGSRVAAMYSKSASEGSSICGVERCGVVSPSHWYKRKFVLLSSHEALGGGGGGWCCRGEREKEGAGEDIWK